MRSALPGTARPAEGRAQTATFGGSKTMPTTWFNRRRLLAGAATLSLPLIGAAGAGPGVVGAAKPDAAARVAALIKAEVAAGRIAGACVALGEAGTAPAYVSAGGIALDSDAAMGPDSICRIASMTKPMTGLAALLLIEEGRLGLDAPVAEAVPELAEPKVLQSVDPPRTRPADKPITIRHLLTHTAGFNPIYHAGPAAGLYRRAGVEMIGPMLRPDPAAGDAPPPETLDDLAERAARLPLIADPGTLWTYSIASDLLALVVQRAAGRPFEAVLEERIFAPLGLSDTAFHVPERALGRLTTAYLPTEDGLAVLDDRAASVFALSPSLPSGGSGLVSTARDYARFCALLAGEGRIDGRNVVRPETIRMMRSDLIPASADRSSFVLDGAAWGGGVAIQTPDSADRSRLPVGAYGWSGGYGGTTFWVDPGTGRYGVLMMQRAMTAPREDFHARLNAAAWADA